MSEIAGQTGRITGGPGPGPVPAHRTAATDTVHEAYSFACMRCGHGWEQSYEIEHHLDAEGTAFVTYVADGRVVPSPLSRPGCVNCDGHVVRIMRAGQVSSVQNSMRRQTSASASAPVRQRKSAESAEPAESAEGIAAVGTAAGPEAGHHWHLSDLLHPFHHRKAG
ncbi:hypothetical protein ACFFS2_39645 [Streptomyces aurantiacus]|uniref:C2H2-type domain-containing protein n=1 Tax=Streptomyces aurantiacus TaxID=47760 RepID=A0A7G1P3M4_9ACTN|nr:hypothetical protein [Streptomyces aurantiacus]BCL28417.1 hypothetical protein GCM10017557_32760 [Streptomyces aurantiacus]